VIRSYPGDFLECMLLMTSWTSGLLRQLIGGWSLWGFSKVWMSYFISLGCDLWGGVAKLVLSD
jgi:hypothetical protein